MKHLKLSKDDSIFVITSAGDNALHYAIEAKPKRVRWPLSSFCHFVLNMLTDTLRRYEPMVCIFEIFSIQDRSRDTFFFFCTVKDTC
jgi:hypothetical protein